MISIERINEFVHVKIKSAYGRKAFESHPDLFPAHEKSQAESNFKLKLIHLWGQYKYHNAAR
ncbi:hypothetical protein MUK42_30161 [Musa troglodytarum]|uniref:Uncharacterized protein n=1 Tax=Musa troglodytarum TaxID=320322 RepID=A0A9E7G6L6_9LILI|nr:hypothetical protein MUK42_30161 [Musa troglodytarum]